MCLSESQVCSEEPAPSEEQGERGLCNLEVRFLNQTPVPASSTYVTLDKIPDSISHLENRGRDRLHHEGGAHGRQSINVN